MKSAKRVVTLVLAFLLVLGSAVLFLPASGVVTADTSDEETDYDSVSVYDSDNVKDEPAGAESADDESSNYSSDKVSPRTDHKGLLVDILLVVMMECCVLAIVAKKRREVNRQPGF